ncbi:MAG: AAA family ATPase [Dehalococcoidia bacterium]|nr:AAA family ATPase [Dehalococcoidia bacterium]
MIVSVAGGKGGTGKTLVATSLALSVAGRGRPSPGNCDFEEPGDHIFLKPVLTNGSVCVLVPEVEETKFHPSYHAEQGLTVTGADALR